MLNKYPTCAINSYFTKDELNTLTITTFDDCRLSAECSIEKMIQMVQDSPKVRNEFNSPTVVIETLKKAWELIHVS
jgi:hypothetical protein